MKILWNMGVLSKEPVPNLVKCSPKKEDFCIDFYLKEKNSRLIIIILILFTQVFLEVGRFLTLYTFSKFSWELCFRLIERILMNLFRPLLPQQKALLELPKFRSLRITNFNWPRFIRSKTGASHICSILNFLIKIFNLNF